MGSPKNEQRIRRTQKQKPALNQAMRRSLAILEMDAETLSAHLHTAAQNNCLLELEPVYSDASAVEIDAIREPEDIWQSMKTDLRLQLHMMKASRNEQRAAEYLLEELDDNGWLPADAVESCVDAGFTQAETEKALSMVQSMEPRGIGGRTLQEVLILQLAPEDQLCRLIAEQYLPQVANRDIEAICLETGAEPTAVIQAISRIRALHPRPLQNSTKEPIRYLQPELLLTDEEGELHLSLVRRLPELRVSSLAAQAIRESDAASLDSLYAQLREARELTDAVARRNRTLLRVANRIVFKQLDAFKHGAPLVPLTLGEIAEELNLSISTVSRTVSGQCLYYKGRIYPLKKLFTSTTAAGASREQVMQAIRRLIAAENTRKPRSDGAIAKVLSAEGVPISRRTITKYRDAMGIPSAPERRKE